jgi:Zn-dependent protease/CBS domain-containing protein
MIRSSIHLFRLLGIPVEVNVSWLLVLALMTWSFATGWYAELLPDGTRMQLWTLGFLTSILLFVSILLHEFSHSVVAARNGLPIRKITLFLFGGVAQMERDVDEPVLELKMAAAGPAMSVVLAALFFGIAKLVADVPFAFVLAQSLYRINLIVLVFNMVPGFPLDGGRILRAAIWKKTGNVQKATHIASRVGGAFAILLMVYGVFNFFVGQLIGGIWLIFIGYFLRQAAQSGYLLVTLRQTLGNLKVSDVMRFPVITVEAALNLRRLVDEYFLRYHYGSFPVLENGALAGMVSLRDVKQVEMEDWERATVADIADRDIARYALRPDHPAETLLNLIMKKGYSRLPVVDGEGRVVGIVSRRDLMETIKMMAYLEE